MCGKAISASDDTYVHDAELKNDFMKISGVLRLFPKTIPQAEDKIKNLENAIGQLENENIAFKTRIGLLQKDFQKIKETVDKITMNFHLGSIKELSLIFLYSLYCYSNSSILIGYY